MGASERNTAHRRARKHSTGRKVWVCHYCGRSFGKKRRHELTLDHVIPKSLGGPNSSWNRVLACEPCNWEKRSKTYEEFSGRSELPAQCQPWFRTTAEFLAAQRKAAERIQTKVRVLP